MQIDNSDDIETFGFHNNKDNKRYTLTEIADGIAKLIAKNPTMTDEQLMCRLQSGERFGLSYPIAQRVVADARKSPLPPPAPQAPSAPIASPTPPPAPPAASTAVPSDVSAALSAALDEFDKNNGNIPPDQLTAVERYFKMRLSDADLDRLNRSIAAKGKRQLSYSDFARIYIIHRRNVAKHPKGEAPISGVEKWSEKATADGVIDGPYCRVHFGTAMVLFTTLNIMKKTADAKWQNEQCSAYALIACPELDPHF